MRGFTLIELLISAAIITIISSIVIVRFTAFDGTVLLKSLAYEVAAGIREAQIYSVSVVNTGSDGVSSFRYPYGVSFTLDGNGYVFFRFNDENADPYYDASAVSIVNIFSFVESMKVLRVCVIAGGTEDCDITQLDISFRRPEFAAIFNAPGSSGTISEGIIKLCSIRSPEHVWTVSVTLLGQIAVSKDTSGDTCG